MNIREQRNELWGVLNSVRVGIKWGKWEELQDLLPRINAVLSRPEPTEPYNPIPPRKPLANPFPNGRWT